MMKSLNALAFAVAFGLLGALSGAAQGVTIAGCTSPSWDPNSSTLTCGGSSGPPVCNFSPTAPTQYTLGNQLSLTASCTNSPTYAWSATQGTLGTNSCTSAATCTDKQTGTTPLTVNYHLVATNGQGSTTLDAPVNWIVGTGPPTGCVIAPAPQSLANSANPQAIGAMTVSCSGGAPLTSFVWSTNGAAGCNANFANSGTATQTDTLPGNTGTTGASCVYTATVGNGSGTATPTATVTVAGKTGTISCNGIPGINATVVQNIAWNGALPSASATGIATPSLVKGTAYVGIINVPSGAPLSSTNLGSVTAYEYGGAPIHRWVTISKTPCQWDSTLAAPYSGYQVDQNFRFTVGQSSNISMMPGETWYVNVRMSAPTNPTGSVCGSTTCNMNVGFAAPAGT